MHLLVPNRAISLCHWFQAAIGSTALDMARSKNDLELQKYGMDVLTVAVLSILITAPIGALIISLLGPRLLQKPKNPEWGEIFIYTHTDTLATLLDTTVQLLVKASI